MKKVLLFLALCLVSLSSWAERTVVFESDPNAYYPSVIPLAFHIDGVTLSVYGSAGTMNHGFRYFGSEWSYVSTSQGVITKIVLEEPSGGFVFSVGSYAEDGQQGIWLGSAQQVYFRPGGGGTTGRVIVTVDDETDPDPDPDGTITLICIYQNDLYCYCKTLDDEYTLLYGDLYETFVNGDTIRGYASVIQYQGVDELKVEDEWWLVGPGPAVTPQSLPIEELSIDMVHNFFRFSRVRLVQDNDDFYTMTDATGTLTLFNKFDVSLYFPPGPDVVEEINIATLNALIDRILSGNVNSGPAYNCSVEGFLAVYNGELELIPISMTKISTIPSDDLNDDGEVNIFDVNMLIDYTLSH